MEGERQKCEDNIWDEKINKKSRMPSVVNRVLRSRFNRDLIAISGDRDREFLTRDHDYSIKPPTHLYRTGIQQDCWLLPASPHGPPSAAGFTVYKHHRRKIN